MIFKEGDKVEKYTGDYQVVGEVRSAFTTKADKLRYAVEISPGMIMIYSPKQLRLVVELPPPAALPAVEQATEQAPAYSGHNGGSFERSYSRFGFRA